MRVNIRDARVRTFAPGEKLLCMFWSARRSLWLSHSLSWARQSERKRDLRCYICLSPPIVSEKRVSHSRVRQPAWQAWRTCCLSSHISHKSLDRVSPQFLYAANHAENCVWQVLCLETTARTAPKASVRAARVPTRRTRATPGPATRCCRSSSRRKSRPRAAWRPRRTSTRPTRPTSSNQVSKMVHIL